MDASAAAREASYWRSDIVADRPLLPAKGARASRRCRHQHRARVARRNSNAKAGLGACESSLQPYCAGAAMPAHVDSSGRRPLAGHSAMMAPRRPPAPAPRRARRQ